MVQLVKHDLEFILEQIKISEQHALLTNGGLSTQVSLDESREILLGLLPNSTIFFGLRTVDGTLNNLVDGQETFGAASGAETVEFPHLVDPVYRNELDEDGFPLGPPPAPVVTNTDYAQSTGSPSGGNVVDSDPRTISNLIADQTANNPAAVVAFEDREGSTVVVSPGLDGIFGTADDRDVFFIPNQAPDEGLSAPFNGWMTFFGQFFDHGLDLIAKGGSGTIFIPLQPDDPLIAGADGIFGNEDDLPAHLQFMALTRATVDPGVDGVLGTGDDEVRPINETTPFVDQNQTYTSHPSHQVFLRGYALVDLGSGERPIATGRLIEDRGVGVDGLWGTEDDIEIGGMATWRAVKEQASDILGIELDDQDALNLPLIAADQYGNFIPGANGFPQIVLRQDLVGDPVLDLDGDGLLEGNPLDPIDASFAQRTGHIALVDIAHNAVPVVDDNGTPFDLSDDIFLTDADDIAGNSVAMNPFTGENLEYDNELLDAHFMAGDGRANENIALTAVHHIFHSEHNRLVEHTKSVLLGLDNLSGAEQDGNISSTPLQLLNEYLLVDLTQVQFQAILDAFELAGIDRNDDVAIRDFVDAQGLTWDGQRLFQTAKFGTEMQYQHLVFEEFARKVQPLVNIFGSYDTTIDPSIVMEFAQAVYRFGHSMLTETVDRFDTDFNVIGDGGLDPDQQLGLIAAFLNPLEFSANPNLDPDDAAGAIVRGMTRVVGNEIDEFVTEALRNNLVGLPLDLPAINIARGRDVGIPSLNAVRADFFQGTGDNKLKPYESWVDFAMHAKNAYSVINFIAAYGTHDLITSQTTLAGMRAAAWAIVTGQTIGVDGLDGIPGTADDLPAEIVPPADRFDFLNSAGEWASGTDVFHSLDQDGVLTTGLGSVDLWIGGLAEAIEPFGGMLGSTFAFVFEEQMERLQDGDRFYYLGRTVGLNFLNQLEQNSFAELIARNTSATHLPGDVFATPTWILEVDADRQYNPDLDDPTADPTYADEDLTPNPFFDLVIRDNPNTVGPDSNYLRYTGADHVLIGGTSGDDIIYGGIGDDTLYGDGGNDRLESGPGADIVFGGEGDDIITDSGGPGPDNLQGQNGNDVISAGPGEALILGGAGKDYILAGPDLKETFGGLGDDFIDAGDDANTVFGNEGDDWIEGGNGNDLLQGDNGNPFQTATVIGNDVIIGGGGDDDYNSESGDDIMVGSPGTERFEGMLGFDWATHKETPFGIEADMLLRAVFEAPLPPSNQAILDRYDLVEGLSGSHFSDILRADNADAVELATGENGLDNILRNFDLISGLRGITPDAPFTSDALFGSDVDFFDGGNIILGGDGSDIIEGRGGNDIIDGDLWLNVRISIQNALGDELATVDRMHGVITAGPDTPLEWVGRQLNELMLDGTINPGQLHIVREILNSNDTHDTNVNGNEGDFDTAVFSDVIANYIIEGGPDTPMDVDLDGYITVEHVDPVTAAVGADGIDKLRNIERLQFADAQVDVVAGINAGPLGLLTINGIVQVGQILEVTAENVTDADNVTPENLTGAISGPVSYIWQADFDGAGVFEDIIDEVGILGEAVPIAGRFLTVTPDLVGLTLRVRGIYQDANGVLETVFSGPSDVVANAVSPVATDGDDLLVGTLGNDIIDGLDGDDIIFGLDGDDTLIGGPGDDIISGGLGEDTAVLGDDFANFEFELDPDGNIEIANVVTGEEDLFIVDTITGDIIEHFDFNGDIRDFAEIFALALIGDTVDPPVAGAPTAVDVVGLASIAENSPVGAGIFIGAIEITDADGGTNVVSITGADAASFELRNGDAELWYVGAALDFETKSQFGIIVEVDDESIGDGPEVSVNYFLNVLDVNEAPLGFDINVDAIATEFDIGILLVVDPDTNDTHVIQLTANGATDNALFEIGPNNMLRFRNPILPDSNLDGIYLVEFEATDLGGHVISGQLEIESDELFVNGTSATETLNGTDFANVMFGFAGNDTMNGLGGDDVLDGGLGNDKMAGGMGDDTYIVDNKGDKVIELAGQGTDTVETSLGSYKLTANVENLVYTGAGSFKGTGNNLDNVITGGDSNNTLVGAAGNDTLNGGGGNDVLRGGAGDDVLKGEAGNDSLRGEAGNDTFVFEAGFGHDTIVGFGDKAGNEDILDVTGLFGDFAEVAAAMTQVGKHTVITLDADNTITLQKVNLANLGVDDFKFV